MTQLPSPSPPPLAMNDTRSCSASNTPADLEKADKLIKHLIQLAADTKGRRALVKANDFELSSAGSRSLQLEPGPESRKPSSNDHAILDPTATTSTDSTTSTLPTTTPSTQSSKSKWRWLKKNSKATAAAQSEVNQEQPQKQQEMPKLIVTSWKMNEFEYMRGTLPTMARGLFTYNLQTNTPARNTASSITPTTPMGNTLPETPNHKQQQPKPLTALPKGQEPASLRQGQEKILIRGYDKFFSINETKTCTWDWIEKETKGPYEVTLKENGCILFVAGTPPGLLGQRANCVVTSKHFMGALILDSELDDPNQVSHADKGREWLEKGLKEKNLTLEDFGEWLWNENLTAVAELCDDEFEEHVLEYPKERSGLYLHGLNYNTIDFRTCSSQQVQEASQRWGFRRTEFIICKTPDQVKTFTDNVRDAGTYDDRAVEGFVVRCKTTEPQPRDYFFKIKYDEPYLMYREWREITKALLPKSSKNRTITHPDGTVTTIVPPAPERVIRKRYPLSGPYVEFVQHLIQLSPELFVSYKKNQGIIAVRDQFLKDWDQKSVQEQEQLLRDTNPGLDLTKVSATTPMALAMIRTGKAEAADGVEGQDATTTTTTATDTVTTNTVPQYNRTVIVPIATIGCGKTTVAVALQRLMGWSLVCGDDFNHFSKNPGGKFINKVVEELATNAVVIADRNNHQLMHRERIMETVLKAYPQTRFVALFWNHSNLPFYKIHDMAVSRVKLRGENHQNLTPEFCPDYDRVIRTFTRAFEPLDRTTKPDSNFVNVIEMTIGEDVEKMVTRVLEELLPPKPVLAFEHGGEGNEVERIREQLSGLVFVDKKPNQKNGKEKANGGAALTATTGPLFPTKTEIKKAARYARFEWSPARVTSGEAAAYHKAKLDKISGSTGEGSTTEGTTATTTASSSSSSSTLLAPAGSKKIREPKYFAIALDQGLIQKRLQEYLMLEGVAGQDLLPADPLVKSGHGQQPSETVSSPPATTENAKDDDWTVVKGSAQKSNGNKVNGKKKQQQQQPAKPEPIVPTSPPTTSAPMLVLPDILGKDANWNNLRSQVYNWLERTRIGPMQHVTLVHATAKKQPDATKAARAEVLWQEYTTECKAATEAKIDIKAKVKVDTIVWTERLITLRVVSVDRLVPRESVSAAPAIVDHDNGDDNASRRMFESAQLANHVTVGTRDPTVKPVESNDLLKEWHEIMKRGEGKREEGWPMWISFEDPWELDGVLRGMMF